MFLARDFLLRNSSTFKMKMSLSFEAAPGSPVIGLPLPDADA
jgi:hypothetical protein